MARISIGCYTIRITDKSKKNLPIGKFWPGHDLMNVLKEFLEERQAEYSIDEDRQKLLRVQQFHPRGRRISGLVVTGEYGYEADLYNVETDAVSYQRNRTDAEMMPFYFLAELPVELDEGVILLQRRSNLGIRTAFLQDFSMFFEKKYLGLKVEFNHLIPPNLINEYLQGGRLTKVRLIRYALPPDLEDIYDNVGHVEVAGTAEMVFAPRRGNSLPLIGRVQDILTGKKKVTELVEIPGYEYDNAKVELEIGDKRKTLDLSDTMKMRAYIDITDDVLIGEDGFPVFYSIEIVAEGLLGSFIDKLGTGKNNAQ